jgi:phospholipase/carboxylesterase
MKIFFISLLVCAALLAQAKPQSWRDKANEALMKGDRKTAVEWYRQWVEADPTDAVSLYNLACCHALDGKTADALNALKQSAAAGWSDSIHTEADPDLSSLHAQAEFKKILSEIARNARLRSEGYLAQYCTQERLGKYLVILPEGYDPQQKYPLIVLLHGHGQNPEFFARVAQWLSPGERIFIVPQGSYSAAETDGEGFSHFRERDDYSEDVATAPAAVEWVLRAAADVMKRYPIQDSTFTVVGFSQGGALAHLVAATYPQRVNACVAVGGFFIPHLLTPETLKAEAAAGTRVLIVHDLQDIAVPFDEAAYAHNMLKAAGVAVTISPIEHIGHTFTAEVGMKIDQWLREGK